MICEGCVTKHEFILHYDAFALNKAVGKTTDTDKDVDVGESSEDKEKNSCKKPKQKSAKVTAKFWTEVSST